MFTPLWKGLSRKRTEEKGNINELKRKEDEKENFKCCICSCDYDSCRV